MEERDDRPWKDPSNCQKLWNTCLGKATTTFMRICHSNSGQIGKLTIDLTYIAEEHTLPIDTLVLNLTSGGDADEENENKSEKAVRFI